MPQSFSNSITQKAYAKLNLTLDIVGKRDDGYHLLQMIMLQIDWFDTVFLNKNHGGITVACPKANASNISIPCGNDNIAYKAAAAFFNAVCLPPAVDITITKHIPTGAGMGGGSADGAAVLSGLNQILGTGLSMKALCEIGKKVGADIPFCLIGKTALVEGIGEIITPITDFPPCFFVVIMPPCSINTKEAFAAIDKQSEFSKECINPQKPDTKKMLAAIEKGELLAATSLFSNAFETAVLPKEIFSAKQFLAENGGLAPTMTGSGAAVFAAFSKEEDAEKCVLKGKAAGHQIRLCKAI